MEVYNVTFVQKKIVPTVLNMNAGIAQVAKKIHDAKIENLDRLHTSYVLYML